MTIELFHAPINLFKSISGDEWHIMEEGFDYGYNQDGVGDAVMVSFCSEIGDTTMENHEIYSIESVFDYDDKRREIDICIACHSNRIMELCIWND